MPCFHKRLMYPPASGSGRWVFNLAEAPNGAEGVEVPCGNCQGCRVRRTGDWVIRNLWELVANNGVAFFATLTFADEHLPDDYSVDARHLQLFMKRLRARFPGLVIRFFAVGEYGEREDKTMRPHYHVLIYGVVPDDLEQIEVSQRGLPQWSSETISSLWGQGRVVLGTVDPSSISYVAGYIFDKLSGERGEAYYAGRVHAVTGQVCDVRPPFNVMSRRPGIGMCFWEEFQHSDAQHDFIVRDGRKRAMPKAIVKRRLAALPSDEAREAAKLARREAIAVELAKHAADNTHSRLLVREVSRVLQAKSLARGGVDWSEERIRQQLQDAGEWARVERERGQ